MAEALKKISKLFMKIAAAKAAGAKAKKQRNRLRTHPEARCATPPPRVLAEQNPRVEIPHPRMPKSTVTDCCIVQIVESSTMQRPVEQAPTTRSLSQTPRVNAQSSAGQPNYISQDEDNNPTLERCTTTSRSIMQEAMLLCVDIYKPQYILSRDLGILNFAKTPNCKGPPINVFPQQMLQLKLLMTWFCNMANSVIGDNGKLLIYCHLIVNPKTRAVWAHLHGNEIGRLAQGMPGQNTGTNTMFFIRHHQVPHDRTKDITYGLIACLIQPEKIDKPNRTRLVAGGNRVHYPGDAGTPTADLLTVKLLINSIILTAGAKFMTMDIKDFYLNTPMDRYEYMRLKLVDMPADVIEHYHLNKIAPPMATSTVRYKRACTGSPKWG